MVAPSDGIQYRHIVTLNITTSENIMFYNKAIVGLPENNRYDLTSYKWTEFYQELLDSVSTFRFKAAVLNMTVRNVAHETTEFKNVISFCTSTTQVIWNQTVKICGLITQEQVWSIALQKTMD